MAWLPSSSVVLLVIFISVAIAGLHVAKGDACQNQKDIGICGKHCAERCSTFLPDGQGKCDNNNHCICTYSCGSVEGGLCNATGGRCSLNCDDNCCNANCASKYKKGTGFCNDVIPGVRLCYCQYTC